MSEFMNEWNYEIKLYLLLLTGRFADICMIEEEDGYSLAFSTFLMFSSVAVDSFRIVQSIFRYALCKTMPGPSVAIV
ncbi:MAG TPA: hypothetical protein VNS32_26050, partial [Flavisolibacter sp.]|nr:hypothetical protein [Flavisolibacter sp.]